MNSIDPVLHSVTRVLKASKHEKPPKDKDRTSALSRRTSISHPPRFASESSLSLSIDHSSYSPSSLQTSTKLENAQAELRACETHLTVKEAELEVARVIAIRDGLRIRCDAFIDCGRAWVDMGQKGIRISADLQIDRRTPALYIWYRNFLMSLFIGDTQSLRQCQSSIPAPHSNSPSSTPTPQHTRNASGSTDASHRVSEVSTIGPSQSASQVNAYVDQNPAADPSIIPNAPNPILGANGSDVQGNGVTTLSARSIVRPNSTPPTTASFHSIERPVPRNHSMVDVTYVNKPAPGFEFDHSDIRVPAAHAIRDGLVPTITPTTKPKAVRPSSGYLTPVSNDDTDDGRREEGEDEREKQRVVECPQQERQVVPTSQVEERPEAADVGSSAPKIVPDATHIQRTPPVDDLRRPTAPSLHNHASVAVEESRPPPEPRKHSESSSVKKSGFLFSLRKVFGTGPNRQYSEDRAREREVKAWEKEGKRMEKEDKKNEKKEEKMERARLRGVRREGRQRGVEERNEQHEKEKREGLKEERRWKPSNREAKMLRTNSSSDDERSVEEQEAKRAPRRVNLLGRGKKEPKPTPDEDDFSVVQRESQEAELAQSTTGGYIVKQNLDLQKNLRGGVISSGHVAPFDRLTGSSKAASSGRRRSTITGGMGDQKHSEGRTTGGSFIFERGGKISQRLGHSHPVTTAATSGSRPQGMSSIEPFHAPAARPSGIHSTLRLDTKFWENLSNRSGSPVQISPTINERGESTATITVGQGGVDRGSQKQRQIAISQPHSSPAARGHGRDMTAPVAMSTPKHQMMNGNTRRAVSVDYGRSNSVSSLPSQTTIPAPITGQYAVRATAEPGESLMSIVDGLSRSNRRAWNMGFMEVSRSRENMRHGAGHESGLVGAGSGRMTKGKLTDVAVNDNQGRTMGRINTTGHDHTSRKDEVVSTKTWSSLPVESLVGGSPRPAPVIKGTGEGNQDDLQDGEDDSASTSSYETGQENFQLTDEEMQSPPGNANTASVYQKPEEIDRRTISPPPAIRFKAPDRADSASPASHGESTEGLTPRRRKSVRVSLHPTFSSTPPAIEDEVDQYMRAPFVFKEQVVAPPSVLGNRNQSRALAPPQPATANSRMSKDSWDDDGEVNAGYEEAKKLFMMAARRERDVMW